MGSALSKNESCFVWCGMDDDAVGREVRPPYLLNVDDAAVSLMEGVDALDREGLVDSGHYPPASSTHENLWPDDELAPSHEHLRQAGFAPRDGLVSQSGLGNIEEKHICNSIGAEAAFELPTPSPTPTTTRDVLMRESPGNGMEDGANEGLKSFFHSDGDELVEDTSWSSTKRGPSLAELLQRVEFLGNVDLALSEIRNLKNEEDRAEALIRKTVLERFLLVMGSEGPGLAVKKCHRTRNFGAGGVERGKWAARTIRFESSGLESLPDGTPFGGVIVWNSKRLFPREQRGVSIADIAKVEHSGNCVWMTADGEGKLGFETSSPLNARFLCRSIDFLVSAAVQHINFDGRDVSKTSSLRSTGTDNDICATLSAIERLNDGV